MNALLIIIIITAVHGLIITKPIGIIQKHSLLACTKHMRLTVLYFHHNIITVIL